MENKLPLLSKALILMGEGDIISVMYLKAVSGFEHFTYEACVGGCKSRLAEQGIGGFIDCRAEHQPFN